MLSSVFLQQKRQTFDVEFLPCWVENSVSILKFCLYLKLQVSIYKYPLGTVFWRASQNIHFKDLLRDNKTSPQSPSHSVLGIVKYISLNISISGLAEQGSNPFYFLSPVLTNVSLIAYNLAKWDLSVLFHT